MKAVVPNFLDRAIAYVAPEMGAKRLAMRQYAQAGAYLGASMQDRLLSAWNVIEDGPEGDLLEDLPALRARCLDLYRNEPIAGSAVNTFVTNVIGSGLQLRPAIDAKALGMSDDEADEWEGQTARRFNAWATSNLVDVSEASNFFGLQKLAYISRLNSGDVFTVLPMIQRKDSASHLRIQIVEAGRVTNPNFAADSPTLAAGIERSELGAAIRYYIQDSIEAMNPKASWTSVEARGATTGRRMVLHNFNRIRPGQPRGIPLLARVIYTLKGISKYTEAEISAAVLASFFTVFIKSPMGDMPFGDTGSQASDGIKLGKGSVVGLGQGEEIDIANPGRPNAQFDPFIDSLMNRCAMGVDLPHEVLTKRFQSSYSAARGALLEAWKEFLCSRREFAVDWCQPIYETWLMEDIALGGTNAPGFFSDATLRHAYCGAEWVGPGRGHIDEEKEAKAAERKINLGIETHSEVTAQFNGGDWSRKHRRLVREKNMRKRDGLEPTEKASQTGAEAIDPLEIHDATL